MAPVFLLFIGVALFKLNPATGLTLDDCPQLVPRDRYLRVFGSSCYQFVLGHFRDFQTAQRECQSRSGHLVVIPDAAVQEFVYGTTLHDFFFSNSILWIGLTNDNQQHQFLWVDGTAVNYTNWASGEPSDQSGSVRLCVTLQVGDRGRWRVSACEGALFFTASHYFVCQYPVTSAVTSASASPSLTTATTPEMSTSDVHVTHTTPPDTTAPDTSLPQAA